MVCIGPGVYKGALNRDIQENLRKRIAALNWTVPPVDTSQRDSDPQVESNNTPLSLSLYLTSEGHVSTPESQGVGPEITK